MTKTYITGATCLSLPMRSYIGERINTAKHNKEVIYTNDWLGVCQIVVHYCDRLEVPVIVFSARKTPQNGGSRNSKPAAYAGNNDICLHVDRVEIVTYDGYPKNTDLNTLKGWCLRILKPVKVFNYPYAAGLMR